uniref:Major facilitator superfamily (MFS) profile domain-containing protein n=1 Tax=Globodera rostochiensis TaxID=31243 RepID=A0A914I8V0_GLORO
MPRVCISDASARPNGLRSKECEEPHTEWMSIILGSWLAFVSSSQYSLYFTSLWPFMKTLDPSATEASFGVVIAAYSLAQIVAAPLLGFWANRIERLRPPLVLCNVLMFVGSSLYFVVEAFPTGGQTFMLICARFVAGSGAAQISTLRAYVSAASTLEDRSRATAFVTGGVAVGLSLGPAFQIAFSWLSYPGIALIPAVGLHLSMFNAPALFAACINIVNVVILEQFFHESYIGVLEKRRKQKSSAEEEKQQNSVPKLPPPDGVALRLCYLLRFTQQFIITNIETIGSAFAMLMFRWGPREVVYYESLSHIARGLTALFVYVAYIVFDLGKVAKDRPVCLASLLGLLLFHLLTFSWPFLPNDVPELMMLKPDNSSTGGKDQLATMIGCDRQEHPWCDGLKQVDVRLYYALIIVVIGSAFPLINVSMNTIFSAAVGPRLQAKQQSFLMVSGGMGRMLGPILIGVLFTYFGPRLIWIVECILIIFTGVLWVVFYKRLVPLKVPQELMRISKISGTV